jgi:pimeloyl-ACP methyl ester carboxylesterase
MEVGAEGYPVHLADFGGPFDGPLVVAIHGLGGSHLNWAALAPHLTTRCRLMAIDLVGHGCTPVAGRTPDVEGHVALVGDVLRAISDRPVILMGNSLGGLVAALCAASEPDLVAGLILVDPALPTGRLGGIHPRIMANFILCALPGVGERYLAERRSRTSAEHHVRRVLGSVCVDSDRVPDDVVDAHITLTAAGDRAAGDDAYLRSARSLAKVMARPGATKARLERLTIPVLHLHGDRDILVPVASARRMAEGRVGWHLEVARDIGHAPQLETPKWTALRIEEWLEGRGAEARVRASRPSVS